MRMGEPAGIFIDILDYIAQKEDWGAGVCIRHPGRNFWKDLDAGKIDLMVDVARSEEREEKYDFNQLAPLSSWLQVYTEKHRTINGI